MDSISGKDLDIRLDQLDQTLLRIERLLAIGFGEKVREHREAADIGDDITAEILRCAMSWIPAGKLKRAVMEHTDQGERTVKRRLTTLVQLGALDRRGESTSIEYRNTGLYG